MSAATIFLLKDAGRHTILTATCDLPVGGWSAQLRGTSSATTVQLWITHKGRSYLYDEANLHATTEAELPPDPPYWRVGTGLCAGDSIDVVLSHPVAGGCLIGLYL
jgi:hypothetical protein